MHFWMKIVFIHQNISQNAWYFQTTHLYILHQSGIMYHDCQVKGKPVVERYEDMLTYG